MRDDPNSARRWLSPPVRTRLSVVYLEQRRVREARLAVRSSGDPIRVVYCIDNMQVGGTELNAVRTAERLDRRRFAVSVVCIRENGPLMARYREAGIPVHTFPMTSLLGIQSIRQAIRLIQLFRAEKTEIVHSHDAYTSVYGTMCARIAGVRGVIASRGSCARTASRTASPTASSATAPVSRGSWSRREGFRRPAS